MDFKTDNFTKAALKLLKVFWKNLFFLLIFFLFLSLIISGLLFWQFYLNREPAEMSATPPLKVNQDLLDNFLAECQKKEEEFENAFNRPWSDPFAGLLTQELPSELEFNE